MPLAAAVQPSASAGRPSSSKRPPALWKLTASRTVMACSSAKTCRSCSTARRPPADPAVGHEADRLGRHSRGVPVDGVLQRGREAVVVLGGDDDEGVGGGEALREPVEHRAVSGAGAAPNAGKTSGSSWSARSMTSISPNPPCSRACPANHSPTTGPDRPSRTLPKMTASRPGGHGCAEAALAGAAGWRRWRLPRWTVSSSMTDDPSVPISDSLQVKRGPGGSVQPQPQERRTTRPEGNCRMRSRRGPGHPQVVVQHQVDRRARHRLRGRRRPWSAAGR